jgi:hypothetical protein
MTCARASVGTSMLLLYILFIGMLFYWNALAYSLTGTHDT